MTLPDVCWQVRARQLWGNEIYTQDSDLVAVLMHLGYYNHALAAPPANALEVSSQQAYFYIELLPMFMVLQHAAHCVISP